MGDLHVVWQWLPLRMGSMDINETVHTRRSFVTVAVTTYDSTLTNEAFASKKGPLHCATRATTTINSSNRLHYSLRRVQIVNTAAMTLPPNGLYRYQWECSPDSFVDVPVTQCKWPLGFFHTVRRWFRQRQESVLTAGLCCSWFFAILMGCSQGVTVTAICLSQLKRLYGT